LISRLGTVEHERGRTLSLVGASEHTRLLVEVSGLNGLVDLFDSGR
jgi:hypothetical protein